MRPQLSQFDNWSNSWNSPSPAEARDRLLDFLQDWRNIDGDWYSDAAKRFFPLIKERLQLPEVKDAFVNRLRRLHLTNHTIWHFETEARAETASAEQIVTIKRGIDAVNQQRNNCMEELDELIFEEQKITDEETVSLHSEPPGLMLDRISILSLKLYHYREMDKKSKTVELLAEQRNDLHEAYLRLIDDLEAGRKRFKIYRQFKTYNDPDINPVLKGERET